MKTVKWLVLPLVIASLGAYVWGAAAKQANSRDQLFADQKASLTAAETWLMQQNQNADGGFGVEYGTGEPVSTVSTTLDAVLAVAAAGHNPSSIYFGAEKSSVGYLLDNSADVIAFAAAGGGANGKLILALAAANVNARDFAGQDMVAMLRGQYDELTGLYNNATVYNQALSLLALRAVGEEVPEKAVAWLQDLQNESGSWGDSFNTKDSIDSTAMAIMALLSAGLQPDDTVIVDAIEFLANTQLDSGGWEYSSGLGENANSTSLVLQALSAAGEDFYSSDGDWAKSGISPLAALLAWQNTSGAFQAESELGRFDDLYATLQSIPGVTGKYYPLSSRYETIQQAIACLHELQDSESGGWEQFADYGVNAAGTARAIEAIASAGGDPQSADWTPGEINAVEALENEAPPYVDGARGGRPGIVAQGVTAAGNPYDVADFAGRNLIEDIMGSLEEDGTYDDVSFGIVAHSEAMMGLLVAGEEVAPSAVKFLLAYQTDGDWGSSDGNGLALKVLGKLGRNAPNALRNLRMTQQEDGGWGFGLPSSPSSTSEVVQGLIQQGQDPFSPAWSQVKMGIVSSPADAILAQQQENGCWLNYDGSLNDPFGTADAILLLAQEAQFASHHLYLPTISGTD